MTPIIDILHKNEYPEVVDVWEASVRATHDFLKEEDIVYFKPLILNTYLDAVELRCVRDSGGQILGLALTRRSLPTLQAGLSLKSFTEAF